VAAGVTLNIIPTDSGHVICNNIESPDNQYLYVGFETQCTAIPNTGFQLVSWVENLGHNSTKTIKVSSPSNSFLNSLLDIFSIRPNNPAAALYITKFGSFTAHFKPLPPPIPVEYWIPLYGIIASSIIGWSIPGIIGAIKSKKQRRILLQHKNEINDHNKSQKGDIKELDHLNAKIRDSHLQGKISDKQYEVLKNEISIIYQEILKNKIDSLNKDLVDVADAKMVNAIKNEITQLYAKGMITSTHHDLLNKMISYYENNRISEHDSK
jgi:hypothetical protein